MPGSPSRWPRLTRSVLRSVPCIRRSWTMRLYWQERNLRVAAPGELDERQINLGIAANLKRSRRVIWVLLGLMGMILIVVSVTAALLAARQAGEHARIVNVINRQNSGLCLFFYHTAVNVPPYAV